MIKKILLFGIPSIMLIVVGVFVLGILMIKLIWMWTIPDLFPGAVAQGLVAGRISWFAALKLSILVTVLAAITNFNISKS